MSAPVDICLLLVITNAFASNILWDVRAKNVTVVLNLTGQRKLQRDKSETSKSLT